MASLGGAFGAKCRNFGGCLFELTDLDIGGILGAENAAWVDKNAPIIIFAIYYYHISLVPESIKQKLCSKALTDQPTYT